VCRLAVTLAHLPAIAFQGLLDELHAADHNTASLPVIEHRQHGPRRQQPRLASHPTH